VPGLSKKPEHVEGWSFHTGNRATLALAEVKYVTLRENEAPAVRDRLDAMGCAARDSNPEPLP
jgi:hypothetical protein